MPSLHLHRLIASGEFATVVLCTREDELVAVKSYSRACTDEGVARRVQSEKAALALVSRLPHPFVVALRFAHYDDERMYLGMEHAGGCDVLTLLQHRGPLPPGWARVYAAEVCLALGHIHSFDLLFRDLKPEHVLIGLDGHVKLAGFGSALQLHGRGAGPPPARVVSLCGTPEYMSPEILLAAPTCQVSDLWSLGCLVCELLTGASPFAEAAQDIQDLVARILHGPIAAPKHPHVGALEASLLKALLVRDPAERLGAGGHAAVLAHDWFNGLSADALLLKQVPAPWLPHLDGPRPQADDGATAEGATDAARQEAAGHAQGALVGVTDEAVEAELAAPLALPPAALVGWVERADVTAWF